MRRYMRLVAQSVTPTTSRELVSMSNDVKRSDKSFSEKHVASESVDHSIVDDLSISSCPLVKSLRESSNIHKIQEYEENDISEQFQNQDMD
jgi:hypothetical protein